MRLRIEMALMLSFGLLGFGRDLRAADRAPATQSAFVVSDMRVQTIAGFSYLYASSETTFEKIGEPINKTIPALQAAAKEGKFHPSGPLIFIYRDAKDMSKPFTLEIGSSVSPDTKPFGDYKLRNEEPYKCATVVFSGPILNISEGYNKLMAAMGEAKLTPSGQAREYYLYWEGMESPNNVVLIEMGIQ